MSASDLRPVDGTRHQSDRVPGVVLELGATLALAAGPHRGWTGGARDCPAGAMVSALRGRALRRRRAALGTGQPAGRRLRLAGRRRTRPGVARMAGSGRGRALDGRNRPGDVPCRGGRPGCPSGEHAPDGAADGRPAAAGGRTGRGPGIRPSYRPGSGHRLAVAAGADLRALAYPQPHPHRARHVPGARIRRDRRRRWARLRQRLVRVHLLPGSPGRFPHHEGQHAGDAHRSGLSQRVAVQRVQGRAARTYPSCMRWGNRAISSGG